MTGAGRPRTHPRLIDLDGREYSVMSSTAKKLLSGRRPSEHGTNSTYTNWGCRCAECTAAFREWMRSRRDRNKTRAVPSDAHGTDRGYVYYWCRCDACRSAHNRSEVRRYRARRARTA